jgi:hypothetical protein
MTAGSNPGTDVFAFVNGSGGGTDLVTNVFSAADLQIALQGFGPNEAANAVAGQTATANSVSISLSDGTHVTFQNITHLTTSNFS